MGSRRSRPRGALPAAVSTLVADRLHGPDAAATVLAAHRFALYLDLAGVVLPVVTADAVPLPSAVRLRVTSGALVSGGLSSNELPSTGLAWGVRAGDVVPVGGGRIGLPGFDVVAARTWRPARVSRRECGSGCQGDHCSTRGEVDALLAAASAADAGDEWLADGIRCVVATSGRECGSGCQDDHLSTRGAVVDAVAALVGRGPGLTPAGDDALAGALLVLHALHGGAQALGAGIAPALHGGAQALGARIAPGCGGGLADAVRARLRATTAVSGALLAAAADGYAAQPVVALVDAAVAGDAPAVERALPAVLAIGHTSGRDTVTGIRAALTTRLGCSGGRPGSHLSTQDEPTTGRSAA